MLRLVACYSVRIHQYLVLTKRPAILASKVGDLLKTFWVGTTVCNQAEADAKIPDLLAIPAAGHWLSVEPMLGPVELMESDLCQDDRCAHGRISWVVCGGESGRNATPLEPRWAGDIRDQCVAAGVPFWFKQWSTSPGQTFSCDADAAAWKAGRATLDGVTYNELPAALMLPGEIDAPTSHHTKS
jgi:protein gp37